MTKTDKSNSTKELPHSATQPTLAEVQEMMQAAILAADDRVFPLLRDSQRAGRAKLFGVYRHAYSGRLKEILRNDYPFAAALCGDGLFDGLAGQYIATHPSRHQNARWFGYAFPEFLTALGSQACPIGTADIAAIEKAVADSFDAPDAPVLDLVQLAANDPELWPQLRFEPHPSVAAVAVETNAFDVWRALKEDEAAPPVLPQPRNVILVWRNGTTPNVRMLSAEEVMMWQEATRGATFGNLCALAAAFDDPDTAAVRAAGYLQTWISTDMLTSAIVLTAMPTRDHRDWPVENAIELSEEGSGAQGRN